MAHTWAVRIEKKGDVRVWPIQSEEKLKVYEHDDYVTIFINPENSVQWRGVIKLAFCIGKAAHAEEVAQVLHQVRAGLGDA